MVDVCRANHRTPHPYGSKGNVVAYELYASKWAAFFKEAERPGAYDSALESLATNHGCLEFQHAFADELAAFVARSGMRSRGKHGAFHAEFVSARAGWGEDRCIDARDRLGHLFRRVVRQSVRTSFGTADPEAMPLWHAQNWGDFVLNVTTRLVVRFQYASQPPDPSEECDSEHGKRVFGRPTTHWATGKRKRSSDAGAGTAGATRSDAEIWRTRSQVLRELVSGLDMLVLFTESINPYLPWPLLNAASPGVHGLLVAFDSQRGEKLLSNLASSLSPAIYRTPGMHVLVEVVSGLVLDAMAGPDRAVQANPFNFGGVFGHIIGNRVWRTALTAVNGRVMARSCFGTSAAAYGFSATAQLVEMLSPNTYMSCAGDEAREAQEAQEAKPTDEGSELDVDAEGERECTPPTTPSRQSSCEDGGGERSAMDALRMLLGGAEDAQLVEDTLRVVKRLRSRQKRPCYARREEQSRPDANGGGCESK